MGKQAKWLLGGVALLAVGGGAYWAFAPEGSTQVMEASPGGEAVKRGTFRNGDDLHRVSGSVTLLQVDGRHVLRFEGYDATAGPDVFFYLTPDARADGVDAVEGRGLRAETTARGGQATLRGDFNVELPQDFDPAGYAGLAVWCEQFNVLFGHAALEA